MAGDLFIYLFIFSARDLQMYSPIDLLCKLSVEGWIDGALSPQHLWSRIYRFEEMA